MSTKRRIGVVVGLLIAAVSIVVAVSVLFGLRNTPESAYEAYMSVLSDVLTIEKSYADDDGYVELSEADALLDEVEAFAQQCAEVDSCSREDECLTMRLSSGITYMYVVPISGVMAGDIDVSITTLEPWWTDVDGVDSLRHELDEDDLPDGWDSASFVDACSYYVSSVLDDYTFSQNDEINDYEVSVDAFKNLRSNQMIVYYGHGGYDSSIGSVLSTGTEATWGNFFGYWDDLVSGRLVCSGNGEGERLCVTPDFIEYYYSSGSLSGCKIFLLSCHSLQDSVLAQAFVDKGADIAFGFDESVSTDYLERVYYSMIGYDDMVGLTDFSPDGDLYSFEEALIKAQEKYGDSDPWGDKSARCVCYPGEAAGVTRLSDDTVIDLAQYLNRPLEDVLTVFPDIASVQVNLYDGYVDKETDLRTGYGNDIFSFLSEMDDSDTIDTICLEGEGPYTLESISYGEDIDTARETAKDSGWKLDYSEAAEAESLSVREWYTKDGNTLYISYIGHTDDDECIRTVSAVRLYNRIVSNNVSSEDGDSSDSATENTSTQSTSAGSIADVWNSAWVSTDGEYVFYLGYMGSFNDAGYVEVNGVDKLFYCDVQQPDADTIVVKANDNSGKTFTFDYSDGKFISEDLTLEKVPDQYTSWFTGTWKSSDCTIEFQDAQEFERHGEGAGWGYYFILGDSKVLMSDRSHDFEAKSYSYEDGKLTIGGTTYTR